RLEDRPIRLFLTKDLHAVRRALISDIHGNLGALEAVLDDIRGRGISEIFCLGDIVGEGPNPRECIDRIMETCKLTLLGDQDQSTRLDPREFNLDRDHVASGVREQLIAALAQTRDDHRRAFLSALPSSYREGDFFFVHGSPRNPLSEYVFPEDIYNH